MKCPRCGGKAWLIGLPAGIYPAEYRCYNGQHGEFSFSARGPEADRECAELAGLSRRKALALAEDKDDQ